MCAITFDWEENDAIRKFRNFGRTGSVAWGVIELTDCCNLNCKWCYANSPGARPFHMDMQDVKRTLKALHEAGARQVTYSGGEPTLYPRLKEAVSVAREMGMVVHMNTNGFAFTADMAMELKRLGLTQVQINIDSIHPVKHDIARGRKGSFDRALQALKNARKAGITCVSQTVLTRENEGEIVDIFRMTRSLGIQRCRMWDMTPSKGCARENRELLPSDYMSAVQRVVEYAEETGASNVEVSDPLFLGSIKTTLPISGGFCVFDSGIVVYVTTKGDVLFCCTLRDVLYNIFDEIEKKRNIAQVHRSALTAYLKAFGFPKACLGCEDAAMCRGGCYTRRDFSGGTDYWCRRLGSIGSIQQPQLLASH